MRRIKLLTVLSAIVLFAISCQKEPAAKPEDGVDVCFGITSDDVVSKSTSMAAERAVGEWCLYICDEAGQVVDSHAVTSSTAISRNLPKGRYRVYAFVNCGVSKGVWTTEQQVLSFRASLNLSSASHLAMFGSTTVDIQTNSNHSIMVSRLLARVELDKVTVDFSAHPALAAKTFTLRHIYLINVAADTPVSGSGTNQWYNMRSFTSSAADNLISDRNVNAVIASGSSYSTAHYFYTCANPTTVDSRATTWSPRYTRLVLECTLGSETTYYSVNILDSNSSPALPLGNNKTYQIKEIVIRSVGSDNPDDGDLRSMDVDFSISVTAWGTEHDVSEQF